MWFRIYPSPSSYSSSLRSHVFVPRNLIAESISQKYDSSTKITTRLKLPVTSQSKCIVIFVANRIGDPRNRISEKYSPRLDCAVACTHPPPPHSGLTKGNMAKSGRLSATSTAGTPLCLHGIAYCSCYGLSTSDWVKSLRVVRCVASCKTVWLVPTTGVPRETDGVVVTPPPRLQTISASPGLTDFAQAHMLGLWYQSYLTARGACFLWARYPYRSKKEAKLINVYHEDRASSWE